MINLCIEQNRRIQACREVGIQPADTSYRDIMQRLVRRYLFKMERERKSGEDKIKESFMPPGLSIRTEELGGEPDDDAEQSPSPQFGFQDSGRRSRGFAGIAKTARFADDDGPDETRSPLLVPPPPPDGRSGCDSPSSRRSVRRGKRRGSQFGPGLAASSGLQLLALPQLDAMQRTQKILDMRMQTLHQQMDQINLAAGSHRIREELEHIRQLIAENQKAMTSVVKVIATIQEQIRMLNDNMHQWVMAQVSERQFKTSVIAKSELPYTNEPSTASAN